LLDDDGDDGGEEHDAAAVASGLALLGIGDGGDGGGAAAAASITISEGSLAAIKRRHELKNLGSKSRSSLENYTVAIVERFAEIAATAALVCYAVFAATVKAALVYTIPIVAFGLFRYWFVAEKLKSDESPTEAMLRDWQLIAAVVLWVAVCGGVLLLAGH
jgi:4-hydroxybenzoate polyprenyltransferase